MAVAHARVAIESAEPIAVASTVTNALVYVGQLIYKGLVALGTFLVNTLGFSSACSNEITAKAVEFGPLLDIGVVE